MMIAGITLVTLALMANIRYSEYRINRHRPYVIDLVGAKFRRK